MTLLDSALRLSLDDHIHRLELCKVGPVPHKQSRSTILSTFWRTFVHGEHSCVHKINSLKINIKPEDTEGPNRTTSHSYTLFIFTLQNFQCRHLFHLPESLLWTEVVLKRKLFSAHKLHEPSARVLAPKARCLEKCNCLFKKPHILGP